MDLGDWSIRNWRPLSRLSTALLVAGGAFVGAWSDYDSNVPALGGPNGILYDLTLRLSQPWRRNIPTVPALFVAVDDAALSTPELASLPRALFQPIWARLIDGLSDKGARRIAFDMVFAYAGADFSAGSFKLPDFDQGLIDSLTKAKDRIVLGRFPSIAPAPAFVNAAGASRVGVLDLQLESDGRVRSAAPLALLSDGRIAASFAALGAGLSIRQASAAQRILIAPSAPLNAVPTYSLATLLACLSSVDDAARVRAAIEGRIVVVGTAVLGEDEHRGPTRFLSRASESSSPARCTPGQGLFSRPEPENGLGALLQIAAIQSAASERPITLAGMWPRLVAGGGLVLLFAMLAFIDDGALAISESALSPLSSVIKRLIRSVAIGLAGPTLVGGLAGATAFVAADLWLPMGYPVLAANLAFGTILGLRSIRHRALFRRLYLTAGRYLPPERLVTLARGGFADPAEGQEREVSILLVDLAGFTAFSNRPDLTASEVVRVANRYFTVMQAAIDRYDGCCDKFLGDAVLAFWNGLTDQPDHAVRALAAAQHILSTVSDAASSHGNRLSARVVVCSGRVYVGDLGAKQRSNFTIIGPAVNETFRLEKIPDLYGLPLLVASSTVGMVRGAQEGDAPSGLLGTNVFVRIDDIELKGFAEPRSIYALVPGDDPGRADFEAARDALDRQMIGKGLTLLAGIDRGMLQQAAKTLSARHTPAT